MKTKYAPLLIALGLALSGAGAAQACDNGICGSGWKDRGSYGSMNYANYNTTNKAYYNNNNYNTNKTYNHNDNYNKNYNNNYNTNKNYNTNNNSNSNYNKNSNYNANKNTAYGGNASQGQGQGQTQGQGQGQDQSQSIANSGNSSLSNSGNSSLSNAGNSSVNNAVAVNYTNIQKQQPVATAYAAPLVAGVDTCMGSTSVGGQGITLGFSFAKTWNDKNCMRLKNSRELNAMGMSVVACELLAMDREVDEALRRSGVSCAAYGQPVIEQVVHAPPPVVYEPPPQPDYGPPPPPRRERG